MRTDARDAHPVGSRGATSEPADERRDAPTRRSVVTRVVRAMARRDAASASTDRHRERRTARDG
jgi:hypothetical protein